jgi:prepilin peptidase CpaA
MSTNLVLLTLLTFTAAVAIIDFRTGHIPNPLVLGGLAMGAASQLAQQLLRAPSALDALRQFGLNVVAGTIACALVPLLLYRFEALGGGDVKLLAAVGAIAGPFLGLQVLFFSFVAAAIYAPAKMAYQGRLLKVVANSAALIANPFLPKARRRSIPPEALTTIRFGPAAFAGACAASYLSWSVT